jgi:RHS repeat-associated protein
MWLTSETSGGQFGLGQGTGDVYRRTYSWLGDQVSEIDTCYRNQTLAISEGLYSIYPPYDQTVQLKSVSSNNFWVGSNPGSGGAFQTHYINYDSRGNRTIDYTDVHGTAYTPAFSSTSYLPDQITTYTGYSAGNDQSRYSYDRDGRMTQKLWPADSSGDAGYFVSPTYESSDISAAVGDGVLKTVNVNGMIYQYWFDDQNRRRRKVYPQGASDYDEYFYDLGHQMLVDTGWNLDRTHPHVTDEYIWLDGRPVAFFRAFFDSTWARQSDLTGSCVRSHLDGAAANQAAACGLYFVVSDHIGKPVLVLDSSRRVAGVGEYQPNGYLNRLEWRSNNNGINYVSNGTRQRINDWTQPTNGMGENVRAHMTVFDVETNKDYVRLELPDGGLLDAQTGYHRGDVWTGWGAVPDAGFAQLYLSTDSQNCNPNGCGFGSWTYKGAYQRDYEYQRYDFGVPGPVFPPLRFAGQYWDPETDFFENWNRYYEPLMGRYTSTEPMIPYPYFVSARSERGTGVPLYAYANNNALGFRDLNGLDIPEPIDHLIDWANDICQRCGQIKFFSTSNGPSRGPIGPDPADTKGNPARNGGAITRTVTHWECKPAGCDPSKVGTSGGSIGVARTQWEIALLAANNCTPSQYSFEDDK